MTNKIDWIIFDLGKVLVEHEPARRALAFAQMGIADYQPIGELLHRLLPKWGRGKINAPEVYHELRPKIDWPMTFFEFQAAFCQELVGVKPDGLRILNELKPSFRLTCLSDTVDLHWDYIQQNYDFMRNFKPALASHLIGMRKTDPGIFMEVARQLNSTPGDILLIDDRSENIVAAREQGCAAIEFTDGRSCRLELVQLGLLPERTVRTNLQP